MRTTLLVLLLLIQSMFIHAQVIPAENDTVNYRLAGFSVPADSNADNYLLEVARGYFLNEKEFKANILFKEDGSSNRFIKLLPAFAASYTWRISCLKKGKLLDKPVLHHFRTGYIPFVDTAKYRVRITSNKLKDKDLFIFFDDTRTLRDIDGNAVWYIPNITGILDSSTTVRDLKYTPQGTISFLTAANVYEINYNGEILWSGPNDGKVSHDTSEFYHHEFTRLSNGHYMVEGNEYIEREMTNIKDTARAKNRANVTFKDGKYFQTIEFGTLIEYDAEKHVVWTWRASEHLNKDNFQRKGAVGRTNYSSHMNSFFFDEKNKVIYVGFRNISNILKISYPDGNVLKTYGAAKDGDGFFYGQHNVRLDLSNNLLLYNNNVAPHIRNYTTSYVTLLKEPVNGQDSLKKLWEFSCNMDTLALPYSTSGGGVSELNNGTFLVCMGSSNRVFIVNKEKKVLWNALCEGKESAEDSHSWISHAGYRVSAIDSYDNLANLILK